MLEEGEWKLKGSSGCEHRNEAYTIRIDYNHVPEKGGQNWLGENPTWFKLCKIMLEEDESKLRRSSGCEHWNEVYMIQND